jgi:hypothetical protein
MVRKDGQAHAEVRDIDYDGHPELILRNNCLYAVLTPRWGGRLVALFSIAGERGSMVVGNPCDDWNWLEELNRYMDVPRNHPGALADTGLEHENYAVILASNGADLAQAVLRGDSGIEKHLELRSDDAALRVTYRLPGDMKELSTEFGLSPDYLRLLREGSNCLDSFESDHAKGYRCGNVAVWVRPAAGAEWAAPYQDRCGHACMLRIRGGGPQFALEIGVALFEADERPAPKKDLEAVLL